MADTLTREEVRAVAGPIDDITVAQIIATGATKEDLALAQAWVENDEAMLNEGRHLESGGRVGALVDILAPPDDADEPGHPGEAGFTEEPR
ncbi:hypothetical protein [Salinarimonas rosea]|uniref:hypothetical protein n=1 Tax=Salinarimonas rosea TaxID=552063 RepID=UPI00041BD29C|nr:hypothetical protein [Salinarimonas rosea]